MMSNQLCNSFCELKFDFCIDKIGIAIIMWEIFTGRKLCGFISNRESLPTIILGSVNFPLVDKIV